MASCPSDIKGIDFSAVGSTAAATAWQQEQLRRALSHGRKRAAIRAVENPRETGDNRLRRHAAHCFQRLGEDEPPDGLHQTREAQPKARRGANDRHIVAVTCAEAEVQAVQMEERVAMQCVTLGAHDHPGLLAVQRVVEACLFPEHVDLVEGIALRAVSSGHVDDKGQGTRAIGVPQDPAAHVLVLVRSALHARQVTDADFKSIPVADDADMGPCGAELLGTNACV
mmetsp:Transcript_165726/g.402753  ORF Transcript_165726/g.402753 Transcript_165726/m.402753 type:complete len:226 (+) Transcript_165726:56-733(+)